MSNAAGFTDFSSQLLVCRQLPANPLNHSHKEVVAEKMYSLPVGDFLQKELPLSVEILGRSMFGQISSKDTILFIPPSWDFLSQ